MLVQESDQNLPISEIKGKIQASIPTCSIEYTYRTPLSLLTMILVYSRFYKNYFSTISTKKKKKLLL